MQQSFIKVSNRKKPNVEEIKAYEYSRKEVEKRIKDAEKQKI